MASPTGTTTVVALKPARSFPNANVTHSIRYSLRQGATPAGEDAIPAMPLATPVHIGTLPRGCVVLRTYAQIRTLFNGTTPALIVGSAADDDAFLTSAEAAAGTAGIKQNLVGGAAMGYLPAETPVYAKLTAAGNTAGEAHIVIEFYPPST
jgi:hypothetical protein